MYVDAWVALAKSHDCIIRHPLAAAQAQHVEGGQALEEQLGLQAGASDGLVGAEPHGASWHQKVGIA